MKYNEGEKYIILEGDDENLAVKVSEYELDSYDSRTAYPIKPVKVELNTSDENIIDAIKQYAYHVGLIGLSSIRVSNISSNEITIGNKYNNRANMQFGLDSNVQNNELLFDEENGISNIKKGSIYLLEKLRSGMYIDYLPSFHRNIGKTTVLLEKANQLANEGKKVLYLARSTRQAIYHKNRYIKSFGDSDKVVFKGIEERINLSDFSVIIYDDISIEERINTFENNHNSLLVREKYGYMIG
ncbi:hypothetical protein [Levilactobacillus phage ENFP1]|nr:hypothetical protein [Levilactobacillus phage ENFP1]